MNWQSDFTFTLVRVGATGLPLAVRLHNPGFAVRAVGKVVKNDTSSF